MSASPEDAIVGAAWAALHNDPTVFDAAMFLAALRAAGYVIERDWQDISTAPRDGTAIDLWCVEQNSARATRRPSCSWTRMQRWYGEEYMGWSGVYEPYREWQPTHWRPLPAPPT